MSSPNGASKRVDSLAVTAHPARGSNKAEAGHFYPTFITSLIVAALTLFGLYALQAGQYFQVLPWTRVVFWLITAVFIVRAVVPLVFAPFADVYRTPFMMWSSAIVGVYAIVHILAALKMQ